MGVSAPALPLSFLRAEQDAFSKCVPLCGSGFGVLLRLHRGAIQFKVSQAMGRVEGLTMLRQSKSPRARPSTSISAVAMLLAKGMLFWSQRREI